MTTDANSGNGKRGDVRSGHSRIQSAQLGVRRASPLAISSGLFGILYGAACMSLGISPTLAALSCVLIFSGAVQFTVLGMLAEPFSASAIAVSSLLICNRLFLMGISIADHLRERSWVARLLSMTVLTDGAWAATIAEKAPVDRFVYFVCAGLWILALWVAGTLLGAVVAGQLEPDMITALRFSGVLFLALLLLLVVQNTSMGHAPWIVSALVSLAGSRLMPLPIAFLIGVTVGSCIAWFGAPRERMDVD
ncbi:MAG: AzlC family ABC transporter permease [Xanthobacteraceae bacterium]|nr:AzlC family ABC transporter permease [Xanthobacteraceae bacterium]